MIMLKRTVVALFAAATLSTPALAAVNFNFGIEVPPPPQQVEVVPAPRSGYVWSPGYWAWDGYRHVWVEGRWIAERPAYVWVPDRWVEFRESRGPHWHHEPGHWEHRHGHHYR
jgi:hypothetical protein